jgi:hypothetical protein
VVQRLQHDGGARLELAQYARDVRRCGERVRSPRQVGRVVLEGNLLARPDETERWIANSTRADEPLDVGLREEVVEAARLVARDDERPPFPPLGEELVR